jgi:hypothetical protein
VFPLNLVFWSFANIFRHIHSSISTKDFLFRRTIRVDGRIILKWIFKQWDGEEWVGLLWIGKVQLAGNCEWCDELLGSL